LGEGLEKKRAVPDDGRRLFSDLGLGREWMSQQAIDQKGLLP
jgi:hypothetical protein